MTARLRLSLPAAQLAAYLGGQLNAFFPDPGPVPREALGQVVERCMPRVEHCFTRIANKYFFDGSQAVFDHLHGDQYAMFLYLAANTAWRSSAEAGLASKLYLLNKALHGIDAFYEVELPSVFLFIHPLGTVLGRASYSDRLLVYQRCSVGSNHDVYPRLGEGVTLRPGSGVLGDCTIGRNCTIAADSLVLDRDVNDDTVYIGNPRDFIERPSGPPPPVWRNP